MSPAESVVYWTEYVVRHRGAPHLKSRAIDLMWYEYFLVDVIAAFLLMVFVILFVIYFSLKKIYLCALKYFQNVKKKCD
jgi:glucuronosyltransferase